MAEKIRHPKVSELLVVGKHEDIVKYSIDNFMKPFVEDIKTLYCNGITVEIGGVDRVLYGGLLAFLADNLAAHFWVPLNRVCPLLSAYVEHA